MNELNLDLIRIYFAPTYTIGKLYVNGVYFCDTIEDVNRDINKDGKLDTVKVQDQTAIPFGKYEVKVTMSNRFKRLLPELLNVPGFLGIRIHNGVDENSSSGCIILGKNDIKGKVHGGTEYMNKLTELLSEAQKTKKIFITIK